MRDEINVEQDLHQYLLQVVVGVKMCRSGYTSVCVCVCGQTCLDIEADAQCLVLYLREAVCRLVCGYLKTDRVPCHLTSLSWRNAEAARAH